MALWGGWHYMAYHSKSCMLKVTVKGPKAPRLFSGTQNTCGQVRGVAEECVLNVKARKPHHSLGVHHAVLPEPPVPQIKRSGSRDSPFNNVLQPFPPKPPGVSC